MCCPANLLHRKGSRDDHLMQVQSGTVAKGILHAPPCDADSDDNKTEAAVDQGEDMHCDEDGGAAHRLSFVFSQMS